jgi:hypothetical protein
MRTYNLQFPFLLRMMYFVIPGVLTFVVPVLILMSDGPTFVLVPLFAVVTLNWWVLLRIAYRVVIHDDGSIEWVALARRVKMFPEDVREISPHPGTIGFFSVKYVGGRVRFINQITGFHEVILHIKNRNPTVILKGC